MRSFSEFNSPEEYLFTEILGIAVIPAHISKSTKISDRAKICYAELLYHYNKNGDTLLSYESLGEKMYTSEETAMRVVIELKLKGFIEIYHDNGRAIRYRCLI